MLKLDHLRIPATDLARSRAWYVATLGLKVEFEVPDRANGDRSTIITSQLPPAQWHDYLADATLADAICDRILHNAHRIVLKGPSRRKEVKLDD